MEGILRSDPTIVGSERRMAEGVGNAPTSAMPILFSRHVQPACICLLSTSAEFGVRIAEQKARADSLRVPHSAFRAKCGCQGWTRTNTERLNRPPCYFDTTWQWRCRQDGLPESCWLDAPCNDVRCREPQSHLHEIRLEDGCLMCSATAAL